MIYALQGFLILAIVGFDQAVKRWTTLHLTLHEARTFLPGIRLFYTENRGAAFGLLQDMRWLFLLITLLAVALIIWALVRRWYRHPLGGWALCLVAGGALGNFIDRAVNGYVVDMFEFTFVDFAIFNVADIFVTVGGVLFCAYLLFLHEQRGDKKDASAVL